MDQSVDEKNYVRLLVRAGAELGKMRDAELRASPHPRAAIEALGEAFRFAVRTNPPGDTSGLVEFQRLILRLRENPTEAE